MTTRVLCWGLLSTARINRAIIPPLRASPRNELVAVASRDLSTAQAYAEQWNIPRVFGSYEALLAEPDIDVIYIPLPNSLHAQKSMMCACTPGYYSQRQESLFLTHTHPRAMLVLPVQLSIQNSISAY